MSLKRDRGLDLFSFSSLKCHSWFYSDCKDLIFLTWRASLIFLQNWLDGCQSVGLIIELPDQISELLKLVLADPIFIHGCTYPLLTRFCCILHRVLIVWKFSRVAGTGCGRNSYFEVKMVVSSPTTAGTRKSEQFSGFVSDTYRVSRNKWNILLNGFWPFVPKLSYQRKFYDTIKKGNIFLLRQEILVKHSFWTSTGTLNIFCAVLTRTCTIEQTQKFSINPSIMASKQENLPSGGK